MVTIGYWLINMDLKHVFINNLKLFRKREGLSQMKLAERCDTSPSYIGEIEIAKKFPSIEMIDKIATALRVEPYHLFVDRTDQDKAAALREIYPKLPLPMKEEIADQIDTAIKSILNRY
jgi:transcriptional regulator with XRE-family HTH domain